MYLTLKWPMPAVGLVLVVSLLITASAVAAEEDPLEAFNREIFAFNNKIDQWVLRPVSVTYVNTAPAPVQHGVGNILGNIQDLNSAINALLQFRFSDAATSTSRVLINTTIGVGGVLDLASKIGVERSYADFGQTLATWGVPQGPYVVLPFLGPSSLRAGTGTAVDSFALSLPAQFDANGQLIFWGANTVNTRAQLLGVDGLISGDPYVFLREAYLQNRRSLNGEQTETDTFSNFDEELDELSEF